MKATAIANALDIPPDRLALLTSDLTRNAITATEPTNAQVLVTTQQRVERVPAMDTTLPLTPLPTFYRRCVAPSSGV